MSKRLCNILLALFSLMVGCALYICFRNNAYISVLLRKLAPLALLHDCMQPYSSSLLAYYLPDFLWAFSFCEFLLAVHKPGKTGILICALGTALFGAVWELLQWGQIISGTADLWDVFSYFSAGIISTVINWGGKKT